MCLEGLERVGTAAVPAKHPRQDLHNAGEVLHWLKPGGDTYLYAPLEMLAGAQLCCICAVQVQLSVSCELTLGSTVGREFGLLMISHVMGPNTHPSAPLQFQCVSSTLVISVMWPRWANRGSWILFCLVLLLCVIRTCEDA